MNFRKRCMLEKLADYKNLLPIRKVFSLLLLFCFLQVSAGGFAQHLNLIAKNAAFEQVIEDIKSQTGYNFFYVQSHLKDVKPVTIKATNISLRDGLELLCKDQPVTFEIRDKVVVLKRRKLEISENKSIQDIPIKGVITDEDGNPLAGVTVNLKGTSIGASTSEDGSFSLDAEEGTILEISYVGYVTQEVKLGNNANIKIVLVRAEKNMDEIVVVGYGTQKKINATGAVTTIDAKILEDRPMTRLTQGLQGAVANLNITSGYSGGSPNATQSINIRGYTGLGSSQGPLIVIDGVQGGDINAINPNDVESISVIKDAAAAAIYGSSAPYGVLLITTKKGKSGKPTITYNNTITLNTPIGMPKMLNSIEYANIYNEAGVNAGLQPNSYYSEEAIQRMKDYQEGKLTTETQANPNAGTDAWLGWFAANANNDWFKIFYKDVQAVQQHNLSISGGNEKTKYFVGMGYNDKPGMLRYGIDIYKRYNVRANLSTKIVDWLEFALRSTYSKETLDQPWSGGSRTGGNWMHQIARKHPNIPLYYPNGDFSEISDIPTMLEGGRYKENWDKPVITGEINITPLKGWVTTINYTYDASIFNTSSHVKTVYYDLPSGKKAPIDWTFPNSFSRGTGFRYHQVFNAYSTYSFNLNKNNFKVLGGYVRELFDNMGFNGGNTNLYTDEIPSIATTYGITPNVSDNAFQLATEGYFARINYNFDEKYLLELVGRYDGSSRFLKDSRWNFYPGISAGWNIDKENFWENAGIDKWLNAFKIRGSYGSQGDQSFGDASNQGFWYPFYPALSTSSPTTGNWYFNSGREARTNAPALVNPAITWVTTSSLNLGIDLAAVNNKLSVAFDWYKRSAKDYLGPARQLPAILGATPPQENVSAIETKGFELTLGWRDQIGDFNYNVRANLSNYKGIVTRYPNDQLLINTWYAGQQMGSIFGYQTVGYFVDDADVANSPDQTKIYSRWGAGDLKYADLNNDGKIDWGTNTLNDKGDLTIIGNSTPQYQYGFYADMGWKNFDASFFIQGIGKRDIAFGSGVNYFWGMVGSEWQSSPFTVHTDRWTPDNTNGYFPKYYMSSENAKNLETQTKYLQNGAYMRLKNVQIGYSLPSALMQRLRLQKVRIFALVENVATISPMQKHSNIDPETFISDIKIYPLQRGYSLGINVTL